MPKVSVPAIRDFTHRDGRFFVRGEMVEVEAIEAAALARQNLVSLTKQTYTTRQMTVKSPEPVPVRTKRRYRRRDMQAETE
jgi:hypothetical protein